MPKEDQTNHYKTRILRITRVKNPIWREHFN